MPPDAYTQGRLDDGRACLEWALYYLRLGWCPIPLCAPDHVGVGRDHGRECTSPGKAPLLAWKEFQGRLPTEAEVRGWWRRWPNANVGIVLGDVSGMVGLDVDGPGGEELLRLGAAGVTAPAYEFTTPGKGGGRRLLYRIPDGTRLRPAPKKGEDNSELRLLANGTQTVAPPSRHPTGGAYIWTKGPDNAPPPA